MHRETWIASRRVKCTATFRQQAGWYTAKHAPPSKPQLWAKGMSLGWPSERQSPSWGVLFKCRSSESCPQGSMLCGAGLLLQWKKKKRESGQQLLNRVCRGEGATYPNVWHKDLFSQPQELFGTGLWFLSFCKLRGLMQASANQLHGPIPFVKCLANTCLTSLGGSTPISGKLAKTGGEDITCPLPVTYALMSHLHIFI